MSKGLGKIIITKKSKRNLLLLKNQIYRLGLVRILLNVEAFKDIFPNYFFFLSFANRSTTLNKKLEFLNYERVKLNE